MPVKKDASGRRSVEAEVEVPGTPEEVWQAIATGPGISSWFVPTTVEEREGGAIVCNFGPGMESLSTITDLGAASPVRGRQPGRHGTGRPDGRHGVDRRSTLRRNLRRPCRPQLVHQQ